MKIIKNYLLVLIILVTASCSEDYLETKPLSFYAPENVYTNAEGFNSLLITMKKDFAIVGYDQFCIMADQNAYSDLCVPASYNNLTIRDLVNSLTPAVTTGDTRFQFHNRLFDQAYYAVRNPNVLISRIDDVEWKNEQEKNFFLASAYFYRAYWYYFLINTYGDVPFIGEELTGPKLDFYTHSRWTILNKIQADMEFAVQWLPVNANPGEITRGAANHLLTKIYLANTEFDKAIASATAVIDGPYALMRDRFGSYKNDLGRNVFWDLHRVENINAPENTETICSLIDRFEAPENAQNVGIQSGVYRGNTLPRTYNCQWWHATTLDSQGKNGTIGSGAQYDTLFRGAATARPSVYYLYEIWDHERDLRRADLNWVDPHEIMYNRTTSVDYGKPLNPNYFASVIDSFSNIYAIPHYKTFIPEQNPPGDAFGGSGDTYIFRLAGTYLLRAEAYFWKGQLDLAAADLNMVRQRAGTLPISGSQVTIDEIFDERARELFTEEPRFAELTRVSFIMAKQNIGGYSLNNFHQSNYFYDRSISTNVFWRTNFQARFSGEPFRIAPYNVLWPIPETVITANTKGVINQNVGYSGTENNVPPLEVIE
ncbi:Starch-binding associating with outer membrane [Mariniphaga anaerophila]|uniref:Starch-binding associating with outer membrane n=1 Tax=Mariniphaga anaerophila TaxID=1484053 RepID=A0A1M5DKT3_9BACT|nr:RagB/SusD family nutrient uptake outer membrane protein [Mariniphaga anaerophila]SHF67583.1 Starch-binding associating with outer membrane [Mariniphaga anaerophila]